MTTKRIPIQTAKDLARAYSLDQVIVWGWDKESNALHVITYGKSIEDCDQAANGGNAIKKFLLNWPKHQCNAEPSRVTKLKNRIKELEKQIVENKDIATGWEDETKHGW